MYILLILFFISLTGIVVMIGRKWKLASNGQIVAKEFTHPFVPDLERIKYLVLENTKRGARLGVIIMLRLHIRSSNVVKNKYGEIKAKVRNISRKNNLRGTSSGTNEVSRFLKMISDYKHKIREIKHKIHEEEKNS